MIKTYHCAECFTEIQTEESIDFDFDDDCKIVYKQKCAECGGELQAGFHTSTWDTGDITRLSRALAVHPAQMQDGTAQKMHPGANFIKSEGGMYLLEIHSRHEKLQRIKERSSFTGKEYCERD